MNAAYNENERKQVIGDVLGAQNIGADDVLVLGRDGVVFAGPNARRHEELLLFHLSLLVREMFVRVFFVRTFVLDDQLKKIRVMIMDHEKDPNNIPRVRSDLNAASRDIILLQEVLSYLAESIALLDVPDRPEDEAGGTLYKVLNMANVKHEVEVRVEDVEGVAVHEHGALALANLEPARVLHVLPKLLGGAMARARFMDITEGHAEDRGRPKR